ncbi:MAG TPA: hypothetical protein VF522_00070 [Ramlibacter sp.]|uniref:hypothetical protein n=1 Tax=Ramlibacter sp. TaxID=1917967 RepID=UPI002ED21857
MSSTRIAAAAAAGLAAMLALLWVAMARVSRRRMREVQRDAWWILQVADTISADVRQATEQAASIPENDPVFDLIERLLAVEREANGLCARPREVLASLPGTGLLTLWKQARELRGIVLRLVLVRTQADMGMRQLGDLLATGHVPSELAPLA